MRVVASQRQEGGRHETAACWFLHLGLFRNFQRIVDFNSQVTNRAFEFRATQQELYGPKILGPSID